MAKGEKDWKGKRDEYWDKVRKFFRNAFLIPGYFDQVLGNTMNLGCEKNVEEGLILSKV